MSTTLNSFDIQQDALTLFFDLRPAEEEEFSDSSEKIRKWIGRFYGEGECIYLTDTLYGEELFNQMKKWNRSAEIKYISEMRFNIAYYLSPLQLTEAWIHSFVKGASDFRKRIVLTDATFYSYSFYFGIRVGELGRDIQAGFSTALKQLMSAAKEAGIYIRETGILRTDGLEDLSSQEAAVIMKLYIESRKGRPVVYSHPGDIHLMDYQDYYSNRAADCRKRIEKIGAWLNQSSDPGQMKLFGQVDTLKAMIDQEVHSLGKEFSRFSRAFPIRQDRYEKKGVPFFSYYELDEHKVRDSARSKELRVRFEKEKQQRIVEELDLSSLKEIVDSYYYQDLSVLQEILADGSLELRIKGKGETVQMTDAYEQLFARLLPLLDKVTGELEKQKRARQVEQRMAEREMRTAGRFSSVEDCFERITSEIEMNPISGLFAKDTQKYVFIGEEAVKDWDIKNYRINGLNTAYSLSRISPCEIAIVRDSIWAQEDSDDYESRMSVLY